MKKNQIGLRKTKQRELVLEIIKSAPGPVSVNEISELLEQHAQSIGIATIYRTVNLLLDNKLINCIRLQDAVQRYEPTDIPHHHHFYCNDCNKVFEGIQPTFKHVPPKEPRFSIIAVFIPSWAARIAATYPPGPPPITIRS